MNLDRAYWNSRYQNKETGWDVGQPTTPLKDYINQLTNKEIRILIPGAGNAYEAEYLMNKGFKNVFVCDISEIALTNLRNRCPQFKDYQLIHNNFFDYVSEKFDLILEQTFFCAINPNLRAVYFKKMHNLLNENGALVGLLFDDVLNADKPPFGGSALEYKKHFEPFFSIHTFEKAHNSIEPRKDRELFINLRPKNITS
jgi:methyl halide transferase